MASRRSGEDAGLARYLEEISAYAVLSREEEVRLGRRIRAGDEEAVNELVTRNLRFVVMMARRYRRRAGSLGDLVNEGNLGLLRAARRFDERKGVRFVTYAAWWVRQALLDAIARQDHLIRAPRRRPVRREYVSLDDDGARDRAPLRERLSDSAVTSPERRVYDRELRRQVTVCVAGLPEREARVIRLCFGLDGEEAREVGEVARQLGVSRTRVRQLRDRGLQRLGSDRRARILDIPRSGTVLDTPGPPG